MRPCKFDCGSNTQSATLQASVTGSKTRNKALRKLPVAATCYIANPFRQLRGRGRYCRYRYSVRTCKEPRNSDGGVRNCFPLRACPGGSTTDKLNAAGCIECDEGLCHHSTERVRCRNIAWSLPRPTRQILPHRKSGKCQIDRRVHSKRQYKNCLPARNNTATIKRALGHLAADV